MHPHSILPPQLERNPAEHYLHCIYPFLPDKVRLFVSGKFMFNYTIISFEIESNGKYKFIFLHPATENTCKIEFLHTELQNLEEYQKYCKYYSFECNIENMIGYHIWKQLGQSL